MNNVLTLMPTDYHKSFYGKAKVFFENGNKVLVSYNTRVAYIDSEGKFHRTWWGYSATTMRHVNSFIDTFGVSGGGKKWWDNLPVE